MQQLVNRDRGTDFSAMPPVHRVSHQGEKFPTLNLEVGEDGDPSASEAPLFQSTESSTAPLTMSFAVEEVEEDEEDEDADKGGVGAGGMGNQVGSVHNLQTPSTSNRPRVNTGDDHQPPSRNPSSRQVLFRTPDKEVAPPVTAGKSDPYEEPMWPYPNATAAAIRTAKESAEKMCGPRNFGTVEFDNFNKAWFFRVKAERYDVRACSCPAYIFTASPSRRLTVARLHLPN